MKQISYLKSEPFQQLREVTICDILEETSKTRTTLIIQRRVTPLLNHERTVGMDF